MIRHEHVGIDRTIVPLPVVFEAVQIGGSVGVVAEDALAVIAAGDDMREGSREFNSRPAQHSKQPTEAF